MKTILKVWLGMLALYLVGATTMFFGVPPAQSLVDAYLYATDKRFEAQSLRERLGNDLGFTPYRLLTRDAGGAPEGAGFRQLAIPGLRDRRETPHLFLSPDRKPKLTFVHGVFDFTEGLHGAILIDENGKVTHRWVLRENPDNPASRGDVHIYPHGVLVDPDGAVTFIFDFGSSITKVDACGRYLWSRPYRRDYNHVLSRAADGTIWTLAGDPSWFERIDPRTGDIVQSISMGDVIAANPDLGIFSPRSEHYSTGRKWLGDPFHGNDIEELSPQMAAAFPMFEAGDLLVSFRSLNLLFVFDPETLRVKWWRAGATQQQHDPDWTDRGTILVLDNRWDKPPSRIVEIDPATNDVTTVLDGETYDFTTINRGKIQTFGSDLFVTSSKQGRVFEVDAQGRLVFDFVNTWDDAAGLRALVSEAIALPVGYFGNLPDCE